MDFYVAVLTVSPVLLVAMAAAYRGRISGLPAILGGAMTAIVMAPAMVAILFSLIMLATNQDLAAVRAIVAIAAMMQAGVSVYAVVAEMTRAGTTPAPLTAQSIEGPVAPTTDAVKSIEEMDASATGTQTSPTTN